MNAAVMGQHHFMVQQEQFQQQQQVTIFTSFGTNLFILHL
jgi:hypothetical protein